MTVSTDVYVDIDTLYNYAKEQGFELIDIKEEKTIGLFKSKEEWICWCCGRVRVIIEDKTVCIPKIYTAKGIFYPNKDKCQYLIDGECQYRFICPNIRYRQKTNINI